MGVFFPNVTRRFVTSLSSSEWKSRTAYLISYCSIVSGAAPRSSNGEIRLPTKSMPDSFSSVCLFLFIPEDVVDGVPFDISIAPCKTWSLMYLVACVLSSLTAIAALSVSVLMLLSHGIDAVGPGAPFVLFSFILLPIAFVLKNVHAFNSFDFRSDELDWLFKYLYTTLYE